MCIRNQATVSQDNLIAKIPDIARACIVNGILNIGTSKVRKTLSSGWKSNGPHAISWVQRFLVGGKTGCHLAVVNDIALNDAAEGMAILVYHAGHCVACLLQGDGTWLISDDSYCSKCVLPQAVLHGIVKDAKLIIWELRDGVYPHTTFGDEYDLMAGGGPATTVRATFELDHKGRQ